MKKLLIVVGAGASLEFGLPSVYEIDKQFESWADNMHRLNSNESRNLYTWVKDAVEKYQKSVSRNGLIQQRNFENTLFTIQTISSLLDTKNYDYNSGLSAFVSFKEFPELKRYFNDIKVADGDDFKSLAASLTDSLLYLMRKKCRTLLVDKNTEILKIRSFFEYLKEEFEIGFINLNYDNVILNALPDLSTGFDKKTGKFQMNDFYDSKWNFCYHIHGSVHFDMKTTGFGHNLHEIFWNGDLNSQFDQNASGRSLNYTTEGYSLLNSNIITGLDKTNQILKDPFRQYFMKIDRLIYEADSLLFIGYGFNDMHLNKLFPSHRLDQNKKRKTVVIDHANKGTSTILRRGDNWVHNMFETLVFNGDEMGDGSEYITTEVIDCYKENNTFEFSRNEKYPLSVWYNGFLKATEHSHKIREALV